MNAASQVDFNTYKAGDVGVNFESDFDLVDALLAKRLRDAHGSTDPGEADTGAAAGLGGLGSRAASKNSDSSNHAEDGRRGTEGAGVQHVWDGA